MTRLRKWEIDRNPSDSGMAIVNDSGSLHQREGPLEGFSRRLDRIESIGHRYLVGGVKNSATKRLSPRSA